MMGVSHGKVALYVMLVNIIMLWPMALASFYWEKYSYLFTLIVFILMSVLWGGIQNYYYRRNS